jgi:hypothetical protein
MTHVAAIDLALVPQYLIVLGAGCVSHSSFPSCTWERGCLSSLALRTFYSTSDYPRHFIFSSNILTIYTNLKIF